MSKLNLSQGLSEGVSNANAPAPVESPAFSAAGNTPEPKSAATIDGRLSRTGTTAKTIHQAPDTVAGMRRTVRGSNKGAVLNHLIIQGIAAAIVLSYKSGSKTLVRETADEHNGKLKEDLDLLFGTKAANKAMQAFQWARENPAT